MGIILKTLILEPLFSFMARRKLKFLETEWNWKFVHRAPGAVAYALKNSVLTLSYNRIGDGLLHIALWDVPFAESSKGLPVSGRGIELSKIIGALSGSYPPPRLTWIAQTRRELANHLDAVSRVLQDQARPVLMGQERFSEFEEYQKRVDHDYYRDYILSTVEPDLAKQWASKNDEELSALYREWCDYRFGRKQRPKGELDVLRAD